MWVVPKKYVLEQARGPFGETHCTTWMSEKSKNKKGLRCVWLQKQKVYQSMEINFIWPTADVLFFKDMGKRSPLIVVFPKVTGAHVFVFNPGYLRGRCWALSLPTTLKSKRARILTAVHIQSRASTARTLAHVKADMGAATNSGKAGVTRVPTITCISSLHTGLAEEKMLSSLGFKILLLLPCLLFIYRDVMVSFLSFENQTSIYLISLPRRAGTKHKNVTTHELIVTQMFVLFYSIYLGKSWENTSPFFPCNITNTVIPSYRFEIRTYSDWCVIHGGEYDQHCQATDESIKSIHFCYIVSDF